jgi:hypothetical protein
MKSEAHRRTWKRAFRGVGPTTPKSIDLGVLRSIRPGASQAVTAFALKIESAQPTDRPELIDALLVVIAYHRVGNRPAGRSSV